MSPRSARGSALVLVVAVLAGVAAVGAVLAVRLSVELDGRRADDRRIQALWLARSAAALGRPGKVEVAVGVDHARVTTTVTPRGEGRKVTATVVLERHGTATVEAVIGKVGAPVDWHERYDRVVPASPE